MAKTDTSNGIDGAKSAIVEAVRAQVGNDTFSSYIRDALAGDFAVELAAMLAARSDVAQAPDSKTIERLFIKHGGPVDGEGWCLNKSGLDDFLRDLYAAPAAAQAPEQVGNNALVLTGAQLLEALDFIAPDRATDPEQMEATVAIEYGKGHGGEAMYVWCAEYPEEGSFVLGGAIPAPQAPVADAARAPQPNHRLMGRLRRFNECCEDFEADGHDVDKEDMRALADLGAVRPAPGGRHYMTDFGRYLLAAPAQQAVTLTSAARDVLAGAAAPQAAQGGTSPLRERAQLEHEWVVLRHMQEQARAAVSRAGATLTDKQMAALESYIFRELGSPSEWIGFDFDGARRVILAAAQEGGK